MSEWPSATHAHGARAKLEQHRMRTVQHDAGSSAPERRRAIDGVVDVCDVLERWGVEAALPDGLGGSLARMDWMASACRSQTLPLRSVMTVLLVLLVARGCYKFDRMDTAILCCDLTVDNRTLSQIQSVVAAAIRPGCDFRFKRSKCNAHIRKPHPRCLEFNLSTGHGLHVSCVVQLIRSCSMCITKRVVVTTRMLRLCY